MKKAQFRMRKNSGFSLGELLITVAILMALMAVALPSVAQTQKNMRQKELDAKAEIIYAAAQNSITKLKTSGRTAVYQYKDGNNGVWKINEIPNDADRDKDNIKDGDICYFTSEDPGAAASAIMDRDTMDEALLDNHWVVEYNPSSAIIYAVFYSEDLVDCAAEYLSDFNKYDFNLRYKNQRLDDGSKVGYYGGGSAASNSTVTTMTPTLTIINTEKLAANISCVLPTSIGDYPVFKVDLKDEAGNTYTKYYAYINCNSDYREKIEEKAGGTGNVDYLSMEKNGRVFTLKLIFDDLSSDDTRFAKAYGTKSDHSVKLDAGTALTVTVTAMCPGNYKYTQNLSDSKTTNSLFADDSTGDTAVISYARHLQNLDKDSGVIATITKAEQSGDITFTDQLPAVSSDRYIDWYETYGKKTYFNGLMNGTVPNFKPIQNSNLQSYNGTLKRISKLTAEADSDAGLFAALGDSQTVSNVVLTGTKVRSTGTDTAAGALVGKVTGSASIEQCQVYLTTSDIKGKTNHDVWVRGKTVGGLIGTVSGNDAEVTNSSASTVVGGHTYSAGAVQSYDSGSVGGLIGSVTGGSVSITGSYADCYLFGNYVGGLVGTSSGTVNVSSCYAAGFATFQSEGAGLIRGNAVMENSYTILYPTDTDSGKTYYKTAKTGTADHVYYLAASTSGDTLGTSIGEMSAGSLPDVFTLNNASVQPYNLMGQALSAYPYPVLRAVKHYGDWTADFQEGTLVYYEKYRDGTYGFYGANVGSTLKNNTGLTVVGDGYGIVYQKDAGNLPNQAIVTIKDGTSKVYEETLTVKSGSFYQVTGADSKQYNIYPLSKKLVNTEKASAKYYLKAVITSAAKTDTYYFNPHFAKTVVGPLPDADAPAPDLTSDSHIVVRTPRHLYMMSLYYDTYANATKGRTFAQERNIDYASYDWTGYSVRTDDKRSQAPIAGGDTVFQAIYDGGCHWITNVNFTTENGSFVGFIGQNAGTVKDVVLTATYQEGSADNFFVRRSGNIQNNQAVYMGVLVGRNIGTINNCAVSGYYIAGSDGTIHAYENSYLYAGGLVGGNAGTITTCSTNTPALRLSSVYANAYLGGFAGINSNYISNSYALGHIEAAFAKGGSVSIAGFAGRNTDIIRDSYCATALTASGEATTSYGFAPLGGQVNACYYLNHGTYAYVNHMYPFNFDACAGTSATFSELKNIGAGSRAVNSYNFKNTKTVTEQYPFRAVVRDEAGNLVHYGDWLDDENMGDLGIFYWEHEEGGNNNGYHFTYLGIEKTGEIEKTMGGTTLCNAHDDGGVITEYGYGYFELNEGSVTKLQMEDATVGTVGNNPVLTSGEIKTYYNKDASEALQKQMHKTLEDGKEAQYYFYAFTTGDDGLRLSGTKPNCTWTLTQNAGEKKDYIVSPFFANAMSFKDAEEVTAFDGTVTDYSKEPGTGEDNQYEIRSIQQLQYINWNYEVGNSSMLVNKSNRNSFTYLIPMGMGNEQPNPELVRYWRQSHDLDGTSFGNFSPIAGSGESTAAKSYTTYLYAWFGGSYDGQSYKIMNVGIESNSFTVGLFGVTANAAMKNIIMHSDRNTEIRRCNTNTVGAYSIGGMVGVAYDYSAQNTTNYIENCAISGYRIVDASTNQQGLGEANVGGLIGVANVNLRNCSAVTDISIECTHQNGSAQFGIFIRVGGLTGGAQGVITNCYSGGSAIVAQKTLFEDPNYNGADNGKHQMKIYICGIAGSAFASNYSNFTGSSGVKDGSPNISNCYTYFQFPKKEGHIEAMSTIASRSDRAYEGSSKGWLTITNCYYFEQIEADGVEKVYGEENKTTVNTLEAISYKDMSNGTLLTKLNGITGTGSVPEGTTGYHNVTTTEGSANVPIDGKYSYPSNPALEGKNYPFPAVVQQNDLTFGTVKDPVYVYVHYGDWPIDEPYWTRGRDTMDIFADKTMGSNAGWATKTFKLNPNGKELGELTPEMFTCVPDNSIAEVVAVGGQDGDGLYPVTIKAKNTGTTVVTFTKRISEEVTYTAEFSLEVTANLDVQAAPASLKLKVDKDDTITLSAKSLTDEEVHFGKWSVETVESASSTLVGLAQNPSEKNKWTVTRAGLGKVTLKAEFEYDYHGTKFTAAAYVDVLQPDTVGLSDGQRYDVAYLETGDHVGSPSYATKPLMENGNFFLYLDAEALKIEDLSIKGISVGGKSARQKTGTDNVYETSGGEPNYLIEWDTPTADKNYQYLPGSIYVTGDTDVPNVELKVTVASSDGALCTLSITLPQVKKVLTITYRDSMEAGAQSFTKPASVGKHRLPTQAELPAGFAIPVGKMLAGWTGGENATVYQPGSLYDFRENVTFTAEWKDAVVTLYANGGTFAGDAATEEV